mmetsp:Transcript_26881/g.70702  ORF Transcript_26881/g.70702 Transcript_26881/m.70702 type:complete len:96 (-) Transcript_26881:81-368(-)
MLINLVAVFSSLAGLGLSLVDLISVKTSVCQEMITQEAVCGSLPPSLSGLPVCITVALVYVVTVVCVALYTFNVAVSCLMFLHLKVFLQGLDPGE